MNLDPIIDRFRGPLIGLLSAWGASPQEAVELAQDTFAEAFLARVRFQGSWEDPGAVGAWLRGVASNLFQTGRRKRSGGGRLVGLERASEAAAPAPPDALELDEQRAAIHAALGRISSNRRTVLLMRYVEGSSLQDIGALLGLSARAVEGRLRRARAALEKELERDHLAEERS